MAFFIFEIKNMKLFFSTLLSFFCLSVFAQSEASFPEACLGKYKGTLYIEHMKAGLVDSAQVQLDFVESSTVGIWDYINTISSERYGEVVKDYKLYKKDSVSNIYVLDENNGILINHSVFQNSMFSLYEAAGSYFTYRMECLDSGELYYEIGTSSLKSEQISEYDQGEEGSEPFVVKSYLPFTRQWAKLEKID